VDGIERGAPLGHEPRGSGHVERAAAADERAQVVADDEPHRDVGDALGLARLVHRDHVRVIDAGGGARLDQDALAGLVVVEQLGRDAVTFRKVVITG
jgi:hypothetical protein